MLRDKRSREDISLLRSNFLRINPSRDIIEVGTPPEVLGHWGECIDGLGTAGMLFPEGVGLLHPPRVYPDLVHPAIRVQVRIEVRVRVRTRGRGKVGTLWFRRNPYPYPGSVASEKKGRVQMNYIIIEDNYHV